MKISMHIPTEQYGFVAVEIEGDKLPESSIVADTYREYADAFKPTEGITSKEMDLIIENMCLNKSVEGGTELWSKATASQKVQINCLKRALSRIKAKQK